MFLIVVDARYKWPEVLPMTTTSAARTIEELRKLFPTHGSPEQLVSDDGTQFAADEFRAFVRSNGIKHIKSAPYHPATNGMAERFVQTFKQALRAALTKKKTISRKLTNFLLAYRATPHALNGEAPAVLLMRRNLTTRLDILKPNIRKRVEVHPTHELHIGQPVVALSYQTKEKWVPKLITAHPGLLSYEVSVTPNTVWRRYIDQLKDRNYSNAKHQQGTIQTAARPSFGSRNFTHAYFYRIGVVSSPVCSFCEKESESLEHIFIHCNYTEEFWAEVIKWLRSLNVNINRLNNKEIMLGMPNCEDELFVNHVLLIAKQYLYFCRCRKTSPIFKAFMSRLGKIQNLELVIAKSKNRLSLYTAKWGKFDL